MNDSQDPPSEISPVVSCFRPTASPTELEGVYPTVCRPTGVVGSPSPALKPGWAHADLVNESALGSLTPIPRSRSAAYQERAVQEEGHLPAIHRSHRVERGWAG